MTVCGNKLTGVCVMGGCPYIKACNSTVWDKSPHKRMSNEEWLRTCSTEELVKAISLMTVSCFICGRDGVEYRRCYFRKNCTGPKEIEEWLQEEHK